MTKSILGGLLLLLVAPAAAQEIVTADTAIERYQETFAPVRALPCSDEADPNAIVVCGRRRSPHRLPLTVAPEEGAIDRSDTSGTAALSAGGCLRLCQSMVGISLKMSGGRVSANERVIVDEE